MRKTHTRDWKDHGLWIGNNIFINLHFHFKPDGEIAAWILSFIPISLSAVIEAAFVALEPSRQNIFLFAKRLWIAPRARIDVPGGRVQLEGKVVAGRLTNLVSFSFPWQK